MKEFIEIVERDKEVPIDKQCYCDHLWFFGVLTKEDGTKINRPDCIICGHPPEEHDTPTSCTHRIPYRLSQVEQDRRKLLEIIREYWNHSDFLFED